MGWTGFNVGRRTHGMSPTEQLDLYISDVRSQHEVVMKTAHFGHGVILWLVSREDGTKQALFEVVLLEYSKATGEFGYKNMDEACGPYGGRPTLKMLKKAEELSPPPPYEFALKWRQRMWASYKSVKLNPYTDERIQTILKIDKEK